MQKRGMNDETMKRHLFPQRDAYRMQCLTLAHFLITISLTFTVRVEWVVITTGPMETSSRAKTYPASHSEPHVIYILPQITSICKWRVEAVQ